MCRCTIPHCDFHRAVSQKFPSSSGVSMLVCKFLTWPSKLMWLDLPLCSPVCHPFSVSVVLVQIHRACLFCWAVFILRLFKASKILRNERKLSVNILCPKPSILEVTCLTVTCVVVMLSVAQCLYPSTLSCHMYTLVHHGVCKVWCCNVLFGTFCLKIMLPLNFTVTSSTA
jgi:hypothetical protein